MPEPNSHPTADLALPPACLVLHGLGGGRFELAPLVNALEKAGCLVRTPTLPGHKVTGPVMPGSTWPEWMAAAEAAFDDLAARGGPVVVVGFSTGGTLALGLATRRAVARLVLLAPFLAIRHTRWLPVHPLVYLRPIARLIPHLSRRSAPTRDREARRRLDTIERFRTFSLHANLSALELIEEVRPLVSTIRAPTLILQGARDSVVEPLAARWLLDRLGSTEKRLVTLPRSDHLLALDLERDRVVAEAIAFTLGHAPIKGKGADH